MTIHINGDAPFQIPASVFTVQCENDYTLYYSVEGGTDSPYSGGYTTSVWQEYDDAPNDSITIYNAGAKNLWFKLVNNTGEAIISY